MKNKTVSAPAVIPHKYAKEEFVKRYQELCKETGWQIVYEPRWTQSRDNGDYRLVIITDVTPIPNEQ